MAQNKSEHFQEHIAIYACLFSKTLQGLAFFFFSDSQTLKDFKDPWEQCVNHTHTHTHTHTLIGCSSLISPADGTQH